jgi:hypothetical protein
MSTQAAELLRCKTIGGENTLLTINLDPEVMKVTWGEHMPQRSPICELQR